MWDPLAKPKLQSCFTIKLSDYQCAIADLCEYYGKGYLLTRVNVPAEFRGKGYATQLLKQVLAAADEAQITLLLEVAPGIGSSMTAEQLRAWYSRHGFLDWKGIMRRKPHIPNKEPQ